MTGDAGEGRNLGSSGSLCRLIVTGLLYRRLRLRRIHGGEVRRVPQAIGRVVGTAEASPEALELIHKVATVGPIGPSRVSRHAPRLRFRGSDRRGMLTAGEGEDVVCRTSRTMTSDIATSVGE